MRTNRAAVSNSARTTDVHSTLFHAVGLPIGSTPIGFLQPVPLYHLPGPRAHLLLLHPGAHPRLATLPFPVLPNLHGQVPASALLHPMVSVQDALLLVGHPARSLTDVKSLPKCRFFMRPFLPTLFKMEPLHRPIFFASLCFSVALSMSNTLCMLLCVMLMFLAGGLFRVPLHP